MVNRRRCHKTHRTTNLKAAITQEVGEVGMIREYIIKISDEIMEEEIADRPQELVRCKNCKYRPELKLYSDKRGNFTAVKFPEESKCPCQCEDFFYSWYPSDDWFCANGKPKEENDGEDMASW